MNYLGAIIVETVSYKKVYLVNISRIEFIKIPVKYLKDNNLMLPEKTHLLHETNDSYLVLDSFYVSVWIPKEVVEVVPKFG